MKIIKIVVTRYHILKLKCTKFDFGWGSAPDPDGGALSPQPLAGLKGPTCKGKEGSERKEGEGRERERKGKGKGKGGEGKKVGTPTFWMKVTPLIKVPEIRDFY